MICALSCRSGSVFWSELQALTVRLQQAAPAGLPLGFWVLLQREIGA